MTGVEDISKEHSASSADQAAQSFRMSRRELVLIVAFWTFMAILTFANRLLDPRGLGFQLTATGPIVLAFVESYLWALLTPLIFWLSARFSADRRHRPRQAVLLVLAGFAIAVCFGMTSDALRGALFPAPRRLGGGGGGGRVPPGFPWLRPWFFNHLIMYMGVLAAGFARAFSLRFRAQREESVRVSSQLRAQLAEARLDALRMQLDPHFLFNTLHAISSLVERDPRGVRRMISRLSELLRHTIEGPTEQEIPLRDELDLLRRYLEIMEVRFQGRLSVSTSVDDRALDALVPNLILQPIVENAIKHGVSKVEGVGRIVLHGDVVGDQLVLCVENDGPPADDASAGTGAGAEGGTGVGVRNTRARLEHLYGLEQSFTLRPAGGGAGTVAEIRLPYHTHDDLRTAAVATTA